MTYEYEVGGYGLKTEQLDMKSLARVIRFNKELWDEVENNPDQLYTRIKRKFMVCTSDSGMKLYEIEEYSDHEYITGYHAWNMCHIRAFLYAKNNDIDNAIESIKQGYENSEIPQVIIDKLVQIANG